jgi:multiple sugar transport system ATP-binding protein
VRAEAGNVTLETTSGGLLPLDAGYAVHSGRATSLGIRPEHIALAAPGEGLRATIVTIEPTGSETFIIVQVGGDRLSVLLRHRLLAKPGDEISLAVDLGAAHLFDSESTKRLAP